MLPQLLAFAEKNNFSLETAEHQNWYPDFTFISNNNRDIKFAVDLKTTYRKEDNPNECNGFTLGSHGEYFINRISHKNIQYPYNEYSGHFCLGIIYTRASNKAVNKIFNLNELEYIPSAIKSLTFFAEEKWKIASDKSGSGNTANIGSIKKINDILTGNGVFAKAGEEIFDDYWSNYGKIEILKKDGSRKKLSSFLEYLKFKNLPVDLYNRPAN